MIINRMMMMMMMNMMMNIMMKMISMMMMILSHIRFKCAVRPDWKCRGCVVMTAADAGDA